MITDDDNSGKFLYFAFGSNLLRERLHISNPSAVFRFRSKENRIKYLLR